MRWQVRARELRRARVVGAMAELAAEHGFAKVSGASLYARAQISRATFYELFDNREQCFVAVLDEGHRQACLAIWRAVDCALDWRDAVRLGLAELLSLYDVERSLARVCFVESLAAGPWALQCREAHAADFLSLLVAQWGALVPPEPHPFVNAGVMASILGVVQNHLLARRPESLTGLLGPLTGMAVAPYLDAAEAAREVELAGALARELEVERERSPKRYLPADVPESLLHQRAERARECVLFLAEHPGASNREIARAAGIASDTQVSSTLARLQRAGLLLKRPCDRGGSNSWSLSPHGHAVVCSLRGETTDVHAQLYPHMIGA